MSAAMYAFLLSATILSALLMATSYGALSAGSASNFQESSQLRMATVAQNPLEADLNAIAFMISQGVVVAMSLGLAASSPKLRLLMAPIGLFCLVGCFLPMSRGGLVVLLVSCSVVVHSFGVVKARTLGLVAALALSAFLFVPDAVFARVNPFSRGLSAEKGDRRPVIYRAVFEHLPDYVVTGVGARAYFGRWGRQTDFYNRGKVSGSHNVFSQVTLYWGIAGLATLALVVLCSVKAITWRGSTDPLRLSLLGIGVSVLIHAMLVHTIEGKEFSLVLGLIASASTWIWPPAGPAPRRTAAMRAGNPLRPVA